MAPANCMVFVELSWTVLPVSCMAVGAQNKYTLQLYVSTIRPGDMRLGERTRNSVVHIRSWAGQVCVWGGAL